LRLLYKRQGPTGLRRVPDRQVAALESPKSQVQGPKSGRLWQLGTSTREEQAERVLCSLPRMCQRNHVPPTSLG
jgi:hypothetical protein